MKGAHTLQSSSEGSLQQATGLDLAQEKQGLVMARRSLRKIDTSLDGRIQSLQAAPPRPRRS
jgi:hypothetical protein